MPSHISHFMRSLRSGQDERRYPHPVAVLAQTKEIKARYVRIFGV
jgi:hypothetical protein